MGEPWESVGEPPPAPIRRLLRVQASLRPQARPRPPGLTHVNARAASAAPQADIGQLPAAVVIARRSSALIKVNLFLALAINLAVIAVAATSGLPLWVSVLADNGGLLVVLANSLWPLTWRVRPVGTASDGAGGA